MKRKILIIAYYFPPENNGGTERIKHFHKQLNNEKYETYVLAANKWRNYSELKNNQTQNVIRKWGVWYLLRMYDGFMRKLGIKLSFFRVLSKFFLWNIIKQIKPDICIASFPLVYDFEIGLMIKEMYNTKLVSDFRDGLMYEPFDIILNSNEKYIREMSKLEEKTIHNSELIITASPQITNYIQEQYKVKAYTIPNGFDDEEIIDIAPIPLNKNVFNVLYTGGLDTSRPGQFKYVKKCFRQIFEYNSLIAFNFVGNYTDEEKNFFKEFKNVFVYEATIRKKVIATQRIADLLLVVTGNEAFGTSGKLFEYIFTQNPILNIGGFNNARKIIEETNSGVSFFPSEISNINTFLEKVKNGKVEFRRRNIKQYTRKAECDVLNNLISDI